MPSKDDIARAVGLEARGDELRRDITEKVGEAGERLRAQVSPVAAPPSPSAA